jgi:hypothetical protein
MPVEKREVYKKRTMVKDRVGMVRASCYDLPSDGFVYGKKNEKDAEGAGEGDLSPQRTNPLSRSRNRLQR